MTFVAPILVGIDLALTYAAALIGIFVMIDALSRKPDAYAAADKLSKGAWVGITVACAAALVLGAFTTLFAAQTVPWLAAVIGVFVYLVDVRPRLREVSGPGRW